MFKIGEIRELIRLLDETSVSELQVESGDSKLFIRKPAAQASPTSVPQPAPIVATASETDAVLKPSTKSVQGDEQESDAPPAADANVEVVTSPMVGTFYRSPSPEADAYVEVGSRVSDKSTVCIVEAMKLMNEIESEVSGVVIDILAENGQLVEYGQPLFKIQRA